ncbi:hypothetical protein PDESU_01590 [Pontiella desulfatans]|uniref:Fibronectin type-III domain-containing protein n=1 Tax=Pontiella desulfatans TaxID=2750659 RepID=A0A6C2U0W5_PONDE|nr:CehA/McbA family metallohydrolase [Pontiella desulfatans]VGO13036.1 hypothetical protein PDESU_01590 [Pontiella desulfatans]
MKSILITILLFPFAAFSAVDGVRSYISLRPYCARADGSQQCEATVVVFDIGGGRLTGQSVTLSSNRGAVDTVSSAQLTDSRGAATFFISSSTSGEATLSALCNGVSITKGMVGTGLAAHWDFEQGAADATGNGNDGVAAGDPSYVAGKSGRAVCLDGDDSFEVPYAGSIATTNVLSIDGWVYMTVAQSDTVILQKPRGATGEYLDYELKLIDGKMDFTYNQDNWARGCKGPGVDTTGTWVHVSGVWEGYLEDENYNGGFNGGYLRAYVDGSRKNRTQCWRSYIKDFHTNPLKVGCDGAGNRHFTGYLDELKLYSRPLPEVEIRRNRDFSTKAYFNLVPPAKVWTQTASPEVVRVRWSNPNNENISSFRLYRGTTADFVPAASNRINIASCEVHEYFDWKVEPEQTYYYKVSCVSIGNESAPSSAGSGTPVAAASAPGWYAGELHCHSEHSADADRAASKIPDMKSNAVSKGLSFVMTTEHNSIRGRLEMEALNDDDFLFLCGEEITMEFGHFNAFFLETYVPENGDVFARMRDCLTQGALTMPNHSNGQWAGLPDHKVIFQGYEIWNGGRFDETERRRTDEWDAYLQRGYKLTARAGRDFHKASQLGQKPWTVCYMDRLCYRQLKEALANGHAYATDGPELNFEGNGKMMGSVLQVDAGDSIALEISGSSETSIDAVVLYRNGAVLATYPGGASSFSESVSDVPVAIDGINGEFNAYYRVELTDIAGRTAVGNPIYIKFNDAQTLQAAY